MGQQAIARVFTERALRQPHHFDPASGIAYQVETAVAMAGQLARISWLLGFPEQAMEAAAAVAEAARNTGHSFPIVHAVTFAGFPVALWTGRLEEARRQVDLLALHVNGNPRTEQWYACLTRVLDLRERNAGEALIATFIEARLDVGAGLPFADLAPDAEIAVPLPGPDPVEQLWNTPEILRVDAELLLWHDAPDASRPRKRSCCVPWRSRDGSQRCHGNSAQP